MFGYITINPKTLTEEEQKRYRACYCGLCRTLRRRYGDAGRLALSNDMTFLSMLLAALYEPGETLREERCPLHPLRRHRAVTHAAAEHAADMNVILAYYKCVDDAQDEGSSRGRLGKAALGAAFRRASALHPETAETVRASLDRISALEREDSEDLDALTRAAGELLGACFVWKADVFAPALRGMGAALGRFVYLMDAYEDYESDEKHGRFNPLRAMHALPDYEERMEEILTLEMAQCTQCFDFLPIEQDAGLLRNVLYSGVWGKYALLREKRKEQQA